MAALQTSTAAISSLLEKRKLDVPWVPPKSWDSLTSSTVSSARPSSQASSAFYANYAVSVAVPDHRALLKFLFLMSFEPYCGFIRSWIYDGRISYPYQEFVVEYASDVYASEDMGIASPLPIVKLRDGVPLPCFLEDCLIPLFRTGQQLQVLMKLLELCNSMGTYDAREEILPSMIALSSIYPWFTIPLTFEKEAIATIVLARTTYYQKMLENMDGKTAKFEFSSRTKIRENLSHDHLRHHGVFQRDSTTQLHRVNHSRHCARLLHHVP